MSSEQRYSSSSHDEVEANGSLASSFSNLSRPTSDGASSQPYLDSRGQCDPERSDRLRKDAWRVYNDDSLLFDPREYPVEDRSKLLESFLETCAPSKVNRSEGIGWIRVLSPSIEATKEMNIKGLQADWEQLKKSEKDINFDALLKLATSYKYFGGNWNLFPDTGDEIDSVWEKIARTTVRDELGIHAKVTPCVDTKEGKALYATSQGQHVINVSIFTDTVQNA
ncbi:UPF0696 protein C11orf68 homolog [Patiria miniata]|uniref:Uncharacterized protein n=1 Tax=Patiria miniata TaxID=46514 RepID=A0A914APQ1_PATMI|nr:UPF0696 protein C11orf68 homolog [Patiria miniata]